MRKNASLDRAAEGERGGLESGAGIEYEKTEDTSQQRLKRGVKVECWVVGVKKANQLSWEAAGEEQRGK